MYKIIPLQCPPKSHILSTLQYCSPKLYYLNKFTYNVQVKTYLSTSKQMFNKFEDNSYISVYFYTKVQLIPRQILSVYFYKNVQLIPRQILSVYFYTNVPLIPRQILSVYFYTNVPSNSLALLYIPPRDVGELQLEGGGGRGGKGRKVFPQGLS